MLQSVFRVLLLVTGSFFTGKFKSSYQRFLNRDLYNFVLTLGDVNCSLGDHNFGNVFADAWQHAIAAWRPLTPSEFHRKSSGMVPRRQ